MSQNSSASSSSWLAIVHMLCWSSCMTLGITGLWMRTNKFPGWQDSYLGRFALPCWSSAPFIATSWMALNASKVQSYKSVRNYLAFSLLSFVGSAIILTYAAITLSNELELKFSSQRVVISALLVSVAAVEACTCFISIRCCYLSIGWFSKHKRKTYSKCLNNAAQHNPQVGVDDNTGHVTVMALPPKQAAELFYTMYRPAFKQNQLPYPHSNIENTSPEQYHRPRRARRSANRNQHEDNVTPQAELNGYDDDDYVENKMLVKRRQTEVTEEHDSIQLPPSRPYSENRLVPVIENEPDACDQNEQEVVTENEEDGEQKPSNLTKKSKTTHKK